MACIHITVPGRHIKIEQCNDMDMMCIIRLEGRKYHIRKENDRNALLHCNSPHRWWWYEDGVLVFDLVLSEAFRCGTPQTHSTR